VRRPLGIKTIARLANVSVATVSRVINSPDKVCSEITDRVREAIDQMGYRPNLSARTLVSGRSKTLGIIVSNVTDVPYFPRLIQGLELAASEHGYEILIGYAHYDPRRLSQFLQRMVQREVDGIAVMIFGIDNDVRERFSKAGKPVVLIDAEPSDSWAMILNVDYDVGMCQALRHLVTLGHSRIGFIGGPTTSYAERLRLTAFHKSLRTFGIEPNPRWILCEDHAQRGGTAVMRSLFSGDFSPTAIICSNDVTAIGLMHVLSGTGVHIPRDISVVGFNDIHCARITIPPLTTIELPGLEIARAAVEALHAQLNQTSNIVRKPKHDFRTKLIIRGSTAAPS
jgi:DNA-binding LacI/PurR family transcriptional regulator